MKDKLLALYNKHGDILRYLIIGGITTVIDIIVFALCHSALGMHYQLSKVISWVFAVAFAFFGNKFVVFRTQERDRQTMLREAGSFLTMRLVTLLFSIIFLYITVDLLRLDENLSNILCNVFVVVFNYILSKLFVFRKKAEE